LVSHHALTCGLPQVHIRQMSNSTAIYAVLCTRSGMWMLRGDEKPRA